MSDVWGLGLPIISSRSAGYAIVPERNGHAKESVSEGLARRLQALAKDKG